jgi:hypothetical protein
MPAGRLSVQNPAFGQDRDEGYTPLALRALQQFEVQEVFLLAVH